MSLKIHRREFDKNEVEALCEEGYSPVVARLMASRGLKKAKSALRELDHFSTLAGINEAVSRIILAIALNQKIGISSDHDGDGVTAACVIHESLLRLGLPEDRIEYFISHKLDDGYGLNASLLSRILSSDFKPDLIITADNGSSDQERIAQLKAAGIDVIVTDHHGIPEDNPPVDAVAFVNPQQLHCQYPDKTIAGCMVAWLVMNATAKAMQSRELVGQDISLVDLLHAVAVGTVSDCVSLASKNNRAIVQFGLREINTFKRPCWSSVQEIIQGPVTSETLAFQICPRIAAAGRLDECIPGIDWLRSKNIDEASDILNRLTMANDERKLIERGMVQECLADAQAQVEAGAYGIVCFLPNGHPGCQGIVSSRLTERWGRPSIVLSGKDEGLASGSGRSVDGFNIRAALQNIQDEHDLFLTFGGHPAACGLKMKQEDIGRLRELFDYQVKQSLCGDDVGRRFHTDGDLTEDQLDLATVDDMDSLEPYGQQFPRPMFDGIFDVVEIKPIGDGTHVRLTLRYQDKTVKGVWFRCRETAEDPLPAEDGDQIVAVYSLSANHFRGKVNLQLMVQAASTVDI